MKQHGMIFKDWGIRAMLATPPRKLQTRRVVSFHNSMTDPHLRRDEWNELDWAKAEPAVCGWLVKSGPIRVTVLPRIRPGDEIWVKETWGYFEREPDGLDFFRYRADGAMIEFPNERNHPCMDHCIGRFDKWCSAMFMPQWASRMTLPVVETKAEWLQDISAEDATEEGISCDWDTKIDKFASAWDEINGKKPGRAWADDPPVWVCRWEVVKRKNPQQEGRR